MRCFIFTLLLFLCGTSSFAISAETSISTNSLTLNNSSTDEQSLDCQKEISLLNDQLITLTNQLKMARRDIAILRQDKEKPGWPEIVGGIGIILGVFGITSFVMSRSSQRKLK